MSSLSLASLYQDRGIYRVSQIVFVRASDLITKFAFVTTPQREKKCAIIFNHMNVTPRGGHFRNFWVGMCRWDPGTLNLYQS